MKEKITKYQLKKFTMRLKQSKTMNNDPSLFSNNNRIIDDKNIKNP